MDYERLNKYRCERFVEELGQYACCTWTWDPFPPVEEIEANIKKEAMIATGLDTTSEGFIVRFIHPKNKSVCQIYCCKGVDIDVEMIVYNIHRLLVEYTHFDASEMKLMLDGKDLGNEGICPHKTYSLVRRSTKKLYVTQEGQMHKKLA